MKSISSGKWFVILGLSGVVNLASAGDLVISQKMMEFHVRTDGKTQPAVAKEVTAHLGDTLVFVNEENDITHNVYSITEGNSFKLNTQLPHTRSPVPLTSPSHSVGDMEIECAIHPNMKIKVHIVK